ncbi:MAG: alpha/beta hydrolase [Acidobacteria bacterium]|nr:alpha/beta hydrolase [Acidobacteriota bacterium]
MPLDPEIEAWLARNPRGTMGVEATREAYRRVSAACAEVWEGVEVEDSVVAGLPVRIYGAGSSPVLVYLHGGRFFSGDLDTHDGACRALAAHSACRVAAVHYRLAPEHRFPAALQDAVAVVREFQQQGLKVGVGGDSAGGNLAAAAALVLCGRGRELACQMLIYPMLDATCGLPSHLRYASGHGPGSDDMQRGWAEYLLGDADPEDPRVSPLWAEDLAGLPPAFVLTAEYDSLRDEGERYAERLREAGVVVTLSRLEGAIHGVFTMGGTLALGREATRRAGHWLRQTLSKTGTA